MENETHKETSLSTWIMIILIFVGILVQGFFTFFIVGDLGQPTWDYRPVKDLPGQSPYALYRLLPDPQHVKGAKGE